MYAVGGIQATAVCHVRTPCQLFEGIYRGVARKGRGAEGLKDNHRGMAFLLSSGLFTVGEWVVQRAARGEGGAKGNRSIYASHTDIRCCQETNFCHVGVQTFTMLVY